MEGMHVATSGAITVSQLSRLVGTPDAPLVLDIRTDGDRCSDLRLLPASIRRDHRSVSSWAGEFANRSAVVVCQRGTKLSQGVASWLRQAGARAEYLEGGFEAWTGAKGLLVRPTHVPERDGEGRTVWVTRTRPKIDRIACPWLIRRFVDPGAVFLFVAPSEVAAVATEFGATPFDIEGVFWSHRGDTCTFDVMLDEFGLRSAALDRLAAIVRAADTDQPDPAPQAAGLLAASLGFSRMIRDDLAQLAAMMSLYDAFYRWARDATAEAHSWPHSSFGGRT
jgi:rhodanese-related sulfurtransferase